MTEVRKTLTEYVADELRAESARQSVTQESIAQAIGRAQSYVSKRWYDAAALTVDEFAKWCQALHVDPVDVMRRAEHSLRVRRSPDFVTSDGTSIEVKTYPAAADTVSGSRDDFDLVAGGPNRQPDGDDEPHFN